MKKLFFIICFFSISITSYSQEVIKDSENAAVEEETRRLDYTEFVGRYKLYPTNNIYNFLKLDTQTGRIWQVQWNTSYDKRFQKSVNDEYLVNPFEEKTINGRFELQKTDNVWNFLLIDTAFGFVYQVQWGFEKDSNMLIRIY